MPSKVGLAMSNSLYLCVTLTPVHAGRALGTRAMEPLEKDNQLGALFPVPKQKLAAAKEKHPGQSGTKVSSLFPFGQKDRGEDLVRETAATPTSASP